MDEKSIAKQLANYTPKGVAPVFASWVQQYTIQVTITPPRSSKLGDYRSPHNGFGHRISINGSLNQYAFVVTFVHEMAHLITWEQHKHRVQPHGREWKSNFQKLMRPFQNLQVFPKDVLQAINQYMLNPAASSCQDERLHKTLSRYDSGHQNRTWNYLDELPKGTFFIIENGRAFQKLDKLRKNFKCKELDSGKMYRISPLMKVKKIQFK